MGQISIFSFPLHLAFCARFGGGRIYFNREGQISIFAFSLHFTLIPVMPDASRLEVFVAAAIALLLMPGPAVLYIVTRSIEQGRVAGLVSVAGICSGTLVHVVAATLGL